MKLNEGPNAKDNKVLFMQDDEAEEDEEYSKNLSGGNKLHVAQYYAAHQRFWAQFILSMKVDICAKEAKQAIADG